MDRHIDRPRIGAIDRQIEHTQSFPLGGHRGQSHRTADVVIQITVANAVGQILAQPIRSVGDIPQILRHAVDDFIANPQPDHTAKRLNGARNMDRFTGTIR